MLLEKFNFNSGIVSADKLTKKVKELQKKYPNAKIEVRLSPHWDDWGNVHSHITLCVYD